MQDRLISVLRSLLLGSDQFSDVNNYAIWVKSVVSNILDNLNSETPVLQTFDEVDSALHSELTRLLHDEFNPFRDNPLTDPVAQDAFHAHIHNAAGNILKVISLSTTEPWKDIISAPVDGTPVQLLNARTGDQAIARMIPVKDGEPAWIFAQGVTTGNEQVSFQFENPTHWKGVDSNLPIMPAEPTELPMDVIEPSPPSQEL